MSATLSDIDRVAYRHRLDVFLSSHDAAKALTADALREGSGAAPLVTAANDVARYADEALAIVRDEYRPRLDCREQCWYCCCKPGVLVSIPELLLILAHVRARFTAEKVSDLRQRAERYVDQLGGRNFNDRFSESIPCPLLVDGRCSVYEVRPLVCRGYNSTNVEACQRSHSDVAATVPIFAVLKDVTDGASVGMSQSLRTVGQNDSMVDLGSAMDIALAAADGVGTAVLDDGAALTSVEVRSWATDLWNQVREVARQVGIDIPPAE